MNITTFDQASDPRERQPEEQSENASLDNSAQTEMDEVNLEDAELVDDSEEAFEHKAEDEANEDED